MRCHCDRVANLIVHVIAPFRFSFLVFKSDLKTDQSNDILDAYNVFAKEIATYKTVLPQVHALLRGVGDDSKLAPECLRIDEMTQPRYFVFEDLKHLHYRNVERRIGLDADHLKQSLLKLAKWHAATAHLALIQPQITAHHQLGNVTADIKHFHPFFEGMMRACA